MTLLTVGKIHQYMTSNYIGPLCYSVLHHKQNAAIKSFSWRFFFFLQQQYQNTAL